MDTNTKNGTSNINKTQIPNTVVNKKVKYVPEKDALANPMSNKSSNGKSKVTKRFSKTIFIPVLVLLSTILIGGIVIYTVVKTSNTKESVSPTVPGSSNAGVCLTDIIEIKDKKLAVCQNNTCVESDQEGPSCSNVGSTSECFKCESLVAIPEEGLVPLEVVFNGAAQSQNPTKYVFDFGDETDILEVDDPTNIKHKYTKEGKYTAEMKVVSTDADGNEIYDTCKASVTVYKEQPPEKPVCISLTAQPQSGEEPLSVQFNAKGSGIEPLTYKYVFGDGQEITSSKDSIEHIYTKAGTYTAKLFVISKGEQSIENANCTKEITVIKKTVEESHTVCKNQACVQVSGPGQDECTTNGDCFRYVCIDQACQKVDGGGENTCSSDADCQPTTEKHLVCKDQACVQVDGAGENECEKDTDCYYLTCVDNACTKLDGDKKSTCSTDADCQPTENKHLECKDQACVQVEGEGEDKCSTDSDCKEYHLTCKDQACVQVEGAGSDTCKTDSDCKLSTRLVCKNKACVEVYGEGENECSSNSDCIVETGTTEETQPVVPETGIEQNQLYIIISVALISSGALILTRKIL